MGFVIEHMRNGMIRCLPVDVHERELIDVSTLGSRFCKDLDPHSGRLHDSEVYYKMAHGDTTLNQGEHQ